MARAHLRRSTESHRILADAFDHSHLLQDAVLSANFGSAQFRSACAKHIWAQRCARIRMNLPAGRPGSWRRGMAVFGTAGRPGIKWQCNMAIADAADPILRLVGDVEHRNGAPPLAAPWPSRPRCWRRTEVRTWRGFLKARPHLGIWGGGLPPATGESTFGRWDPESAGRSYCFTFSIITRSPPTTPKLRLLRALHPLLLLTQRELLHILVNTVVATCARPPHSTSAA